MSRLDYVATGRVMSISHNADMDGIGAVAMLKMKYKISDRDIFLINYSREELADVEKAIRKAKPENTLLFITDLGVNADKVDLFLSIIKTIKRGGGKVYWLDHHMWPEEMAKKIEKECEKLVHDRKNECASEIVIKELGLKGKSVEKFRKICHASDFNLQPKDKRVMSIIIRYAMGIAAYNVKPKLTAQKKLKALARSLSEGSMANKDMERAAAAFTKLSNGRINGMVKDLALIGDKIAVGFARSLQSSNACYEIIKTSGRDVGIFINLDAHRGNIRSVVNNINPLARSMGGGGHPNASGFQFNPEKFDVATRTGRLKLLDYIDQKAALVKL